MSRAIDERVVEMQFQNDQFERGIKQSTKSLKNLKESLKLDDSAESTRKLGKAFDDLSSVSLSSLDTALQTAGRGFNAFETMATSALATVTSQITSYVTSIAKSLSIDQISEGFSKYEEIIGSTKTIMAATGKTANEVDQALSKMNWFSDETSYNLSDMTDNVSKFVNAGVELDTSIDAMIGIANWAAVSGQNATTAARAMYNMSQAIAAGKMQLLDWRSIQNANMNTQEFMQTAIDTAVALGTLSDVQGKVMTKDKKLAVTTGTFANTLNKGWFTTEVMLETLKKYSNYTDEVYQMCQTEGILASEAMDRLADSTDELGKKSFEAGQQSKSFKDSLDATKDAVSSQWMQTFKYVFGNLDESIELWTQVTEILWDVFAAGGKARNEILKFWYENGGRSSLLSAFQNLYDVISAIADIADQAFKSIIPPMTGERLVELTRRFENFTLQIKNAIGFIEGFKDTVQETIDAITGADSGVSETNLVSGAAEADAEEAKKIYDAMPDWMKKWADKNSDVALPLIRAWSRKSNFDTWAKYQAAKLGIPVDLIKKQYDAYNKLNSTAQARLQEGKKRDWADGKKWSAGYLAAWNAYWDAADAVEAAISGTKEATDEAGEGLKETGDAAEEAGESVYSTLTIYEKLTKIVQGFAAVVDVVKQALSAIGYGITKLIPAMKPLADVFTDILAEIADWIVGQDEALKQGETFKNGMDAVVGFLTPIIRGLADTIQFLWESFKGIRSAVKESSLFAAFVEKIFAGWVWLKGFGEELKSTDGYGIVGVIREFAKKFVDAIEQFFLIDTSDVSGFKEKLFKRLQPFLDIFTWIEGIFIGQDDLDAVSGADGKRSYFDRIKIFFANLFNGIADGIDSIAQSEEFARVKESVLGFIETIKTTISELIKPAETETTKGLFDPIIDWLFPKALAEEDTAELQNEGDALEKAASTLDTIGDYIKRFGEAVANIFQKIADYVTPAFTYAIDTGLTVMRLYKGITMAKAILGLTSAADNIAKGFKKLAQAKKMENADSIGDTFLKMAGAILMVAGAIYLIGTMDAGALAQGGIVTAAIAAALIGIAAAFGVLSKKFPDTAKVGDQIKGIGEAILMLAGSILILGYLDAGKIRQGMGFMAAIIGGITGFLFAVKTLGLDKSAGEIENLAKGILMLTASIAILGYLDARKIRQGMGFMAVILGGIAAFLFAVKTLDLEKSAGDIKGLAIGILVLVASIAILGSLDTGTLIKGVGGLVAIMLSLGAFLKLTEKTDPKKALPAIIAMAAVMVVFAGCIDYIKDVPWQTIAAFSVGLSAIALTLTGVMTILANMPFASGLKAIGLLSAAILALGAVFGLVLDLVSDSISSALVQLSSALELAGGMISGFVSSMDGVDSDRVDELKQIFETLFSLVASVPASDGTALITFSGNLSQMGAALGLFIANSDGVTSESIAPRVEAIQSLLDILTQVSTTEFANIQDFIGYITDLGGALTLFASADSGLNGKEADARVQNATALLSSLIENLPDNLTTRLSALPEENSMSIFSARLVSLGGALVSFGNSASGVNRDDVNNAIVSLGMLSELETTLKNHGGIFETVTGISSLDTFSVSVADIGGGLAAFAEKTSGIDSNKVTNAIGSLRLLSTLEWGLRNHGSLFGFFTGDSSLTSFATGVNAIGEGLYNFSEKTKNVDSGKVTSAANALSIFAAIDRGLTNHGGVLAWFTGDQNLSDLGNNLEPLGTGLAAFCKALDGVKNTTVASQAATILQKLAVADTNLNLAGNVLQLQTFANSLHDGKGGGIGEKLKLFSDDLAGFDSGIVGSATNALKDLSLVDSNSLESLGKKFKDGIFTSSVMTSITTGITSLVSSMTTELRNYYTDFHSAGEYLDMGLANGILSGDWRVANAARYVASVAVKASRQTLAINSPSRIGAELGMYWDMGMANGLNHYASLVSDAARESSQNAVDTAKGIVAKVSEVMSSDMSFAPTITPVLDASNIQSGIGGINSLFGGRVITLNGVSTVQLADRTEQSIPNQNGSDYASIVNAIGNVNNQIEELGQRIARMQVVLDSGALVGQIAGDIDKTLGERTIMKGRGN